MFSWSVAWQPKERQGLQSDATSVGVLDVSPRALVDDALPGRINGWTQILNILTIHYGDRIEAAN